MRKIRFSIARMMGLVLVIAVGCAVLRNSDEAWAGTLLLLTGSAVMLSVIGAICGKPESRARWLGFAFFAGGSLILAAWTAATPLVIPTLALAGQIADWMGQTLYDPSKTWGESWDTLPPPYRIVHCLSALVLGLIGSLLAWLLVGGPAAPVSPVADAEPRRRPGSRAVWIGLAVFWVLVIAAVVGRWPMPGFWADAGFLLSCALLGLAALGAMFARRSDRAVWLGASLFGFGYLALTFGKSTGLIVAPHLPTEALINSLLRSGEVAIAAGFPDFSTGSFKRVKTAIMLRKLEEPIPFHYPKETPLADVLKDIRKATNIPIYVDPVGLQEAGRSMNSTVQIDLDSIPMKDGLRLVLKQLGLVCSLRTGYLMISTEDRTMIPVYEDPLQVVGHSLMALVAAALGYFVADRVVNRRRAAGSIEP